MKRIATFLLLSWACLMGYAQHLDARLQTMVDRLTKFGQNIPQEKVYLHMDNTCYFVGDTIWYAAYTRSTHNDKPSKLSGTLYVELYNQDGYLVERQLVEMINGRGHGNFELTKDCYGGFYELRAYTRWQLNWGQFQHKSSSVSKEWFLNNELHDNYYKDYDKLYSRVFPVYDASKDGNYIENMTLRPMRRYFKKDPESRELKLNLYPEGGNVVEGLPCRVAYEVAWDDGQQVELTDNTPSRGIIEVTPGKGTDRKIRFTTKGGKKVTASLPKPEKEGVALKVTQSESDWTFNLQLSQGLDPKDVAMTIMHEGVVQKVSGISDRQVTFDVAKSELKEGVNQVTVFDVKGRILADRLFFNMQPGLTKYPSTASLSGITTSASGTPANPSMSGTATSSLSGDTSPETKTGASKAGSHSTFGRVGVSLGGKDANKPLNETTFAPYAPIQLQVQSEPNALLSMSVRDAAHCDELNDNATMRMEMLLSSEIKGFVANPQYYFERDDEKHRTDLDLLMMIQGWRRFNWSDMAIPHQFELTQPLEKTPVIRGRVYYNPETPDHLLGDKQFMRRATTAGMHHPTAIALYYADLLVNPFKKDAAPSSNGSSGGRSGGSASSEEDNYEEEVNNKEPFRPKESEDGTSNTNDEERERFKLSKKKRKELLVHLELASIDGKEVRVQETMTKNGEFAFQLPGFYGNAIMFLSASDSTKWDKKEKKKPAKHVWIQLKGLEEDLPDGHRRRFRVWPPEWTVRQFTPYPRFVKPYNYYQTELLQCGDSVMEALRLQDGTTQMKEVRIGAKRSGLKRFSDSIPAFMVDAYDAYNYALDAGMFSTYPEDIVRAYVGDYGMDFPFNDIQIPILSGELSSPPPEAHIQHSNIEVRFGYDQSRRATNLKTMDTDSAYFRSNLISFKPYDHYGNIQAFLTYKALREYYYMNNLDKYVIYTDYQPRLAGDDRYYGSLLPNTQISVYPFPDGTQRAYYRDRRYVQYGYNYADDFYHVDYQNRKLDSKPKDYRRTLYWNPDLQLDGEGRATIQLYNNGKSGQIRVSAEGMTTGGKILESK